MSITRRQFILASVGAGAGLILPRYYDKVVSYFENHGEPLLETPARFDEDLYADYGGLDYQLNLGKPAYDLPEITWREAFDRYLGWIPEPEELQDDYDLTIADLGKPADIDFYLDAWCIHDSPNAKAFYLLDSLDIGSDAGCGNRIGGLVFYNGPMPGNDYTGVHAESGVTLSLLQHRLNELKAGIRVLMF